MARKPIRKRVATTVGRNPKECPPHGEPTEAGEAEVCLECDKAIRGIGDPCWKHGEIHTPDPELLRGAPPPPATSARPQRRWLVEVLGMEPVTLFAKARPQAKRVAKKLLKLDELPGGTRIVEIP